MANSNRRSNTTEWDDILVKKGIVGPRPKSPERDTIFSGPIGDEEADPDRLEGLTLDELDELEDEEDEDFMAKYREQRMAQMKAQAVRNRFGTLTQLSKPDFVKEVNEAGEGVWVVLHLYQDSLEICRSLNEILAKLAVKFRYVKFMKIVATNCIENYPDKNVPTFLLYKDGELQEQIVGPAPFGGASVSADEVEWMLGRREIVETDIQENPRQGRKKLNILRGRLGMDDEESDDSA